MRVRDVRLPAVALTVVMAVAATSGCGGAAPVAAPVPASSVPVSEAAVSPSPTPELSPSLVPTPTRSPSATPSKKASASPAATRAGGAGPRTAGLAGKTIVIDPGHNRNNFQHAAEIGKQVPDGNGGQKTCDTTGTSTNDGYTEAAYTWDVAQRLAGLLRAAGANVVMTLGADTPWGPCITERARIGNTSKAAVVIGIHADGGTAGGTGFHVMEPGLPGPIQAESHRLAIAVRDAYRAAGMRPASYIGTDGLNPRVDMAGLNLSTVPKVMLEGGNMRNASDAAMLKSPEFRQKTAEALVTALSTFLS